MGDSDNVDGWKKELRPGLESVLLCELRTYEQCRIVNVQLGRIVSQCNSTSARVKMNGAFLTKEKKEL